PAARPVEDQGKAVGEEPPDPCQENDLPPVTAARAVSTSRDSLATSDGSGKRLRTADRWVAARWYSTTSSSASPALSRRRRLSSSRRRHSASCSATNASRSTVPPRTRCPQRRLPADTVWGGQLR